MCARPSSHGAPAARALPGAQAPSSGRVSPAGSGRPEDRGRWPARGRHRGRRRKRPRSWRFLGTMTGRPTSSPSSLGQPGLGLRCGFVQTGKRGPVRQNPEQVRARPAPKPTGAAHARPLGAAATVRDRLWVGCRPRPWPTVRGEPGSSGRAGLGVPCPLSFACYIVANGIDKKTARNASGLGDQT